MFAAVSLPADISIEPPMCHCIGLGSREFCVQGLGQRARPHALPNVTHSQRACLYFDYRLFACASILNELMSLTNKCAAQKRDSFCENVVFFHNGMFCISARSTIFPWPMDKTWTGRNYPEMKNGCQG